MFWATKIPITEFETICILEFTAIGAVGDFSEITFSEFYVNENNISNEITDGYVEIVEISEFQIPSCFTPNNDGFNDVFYISGLSTQDNTSITIFDEYAVEVYKSSENFWNGIKKDGNEVKSQEIYLYKIVINNKIYRGWLYIKK